jgi:transposase, IS5 family
MKAKKQFLTLPLFQADLNQCLNPDHPLYQLAQQIDWSVFEAAFGPTYSEGQGRPAKPIRLLVGLHYLKHAFNESDETVVARWLENPYWQYFCGFDRFQHEFPLDPSLLVKWRQRVGFEKLEALLQETIACARREKLLPAAHLDRVNVDTTVQEKNITFPTDGKLYQKMRLQLVSAAKKLGLKLRQTYTFKAKEALVLQHRYAHARQTRRAAKMTKRLKIYLGRVVRDLERQAAEPLQELLAQARRLLAQQRTDKGKLYSLHEPDVECIAKGKAHKKYEFGCKVAVLTTSQSSWVVGVGAFHGNPWDGHTLTQSLAAMERTVGVAPAHAYCDRGYRGHDYAGETQIHVAGQGKKNRSRWEKRFSKRRAAIEPTIGHLKSDNRLDRCYLSGKQGDRINALLAACGYNLRKLLKAFFLPFFHRLIRAIVTLFLLADCSVNEAKAY